MIVIPVGMRFTEDFFASLGFSLHLAGTSMNVRFPIGCASLGRFGRLSVLCYFAP
jgi:hypothetical protein